LPHRIISRDEDSNLVKKNLDFIIPKNRDFILIIDDRRDVQHDVFIGLESFQFVCFYTALHIFLLRGGD